MVLSAGGIATFNIQHGYVEGLVRGYRSGILDDVDYHHLTQCESIEGNGRSREVVTMTAPEFSLDGAWNRREAQSPGDGLRPVPGR